MIERIVPARPAGERGIPRHVAIVARGGAPSDGERGAAVLRDTLLAFADHGVAIVSVYAPPDAVGLVDPLAFVRHAGELRRANVRIETRTACSSLDALREAALESLRARTVRCDGLRVHLMIGYSGRADVRTAAIALARDIRDGRREAPLPGEDALADYLATAGVPDPDLLIATGDCGRIEDFLLYQIAYAELWSTKNDWSAFDTRNIDAAMRSFTGRQRRFGT